MISKFQLLSVLLFFFTWTKGSFTQAQSKVEQLSDSQVKAFYERAKSGGMSEMQIEQAALAQGFTLSDISLMRKRLAEVQNKENNLESDTTENTKATRQQIGQLSKRVIKKDSAKLPKKEPLKIFGSDLFNTEGLSFEPSLRIATPKNYQLGPDDELLVEIYGDAKGSYRLKVSPEGTVKVLNLAPIYISGLSVEEARDKIVSRLRQSYSGLNSGGSFASINLGNIRSIRVMVTGEVVKPGVYTVSSLATAFNALYLCGGPNKNGSFRTVNVVRNNKIVRVIDIYDFLLRANQADNIILQDQDIIQVPFYLTRVELDGEIKRPAIYELKKGESLQQLVDLAGGFNEQAYQSSVTLRRNTEKARKVVTVDRKDFTGFLPQSGDIVNVGKILDRYENKVVIEGAVFRPGEYALGENLKTLKDLLKQSEGVREDAFLNRAIIHREKPNREPEVLAVSLGKILNNEMPDIELRAQDSIVVKSVKDLREEYFVTIMGEINTPGDFEYADHMTVSDLIAQANGLSEGAIDSRIEIARRIKDTNLSEVTDNVMMQIITLKINRDLSLSNNDKQLQLQPFDIVYIRKSTRYDKQRSVVILGEVNYPGTYAIQNSGERITQLIERAGGPKSTGYLPNAIFRRSGERIALDIQRVVENPSLESNIILEEGDTIYIPERSELVRIEGAVLNPSTVNFSKGFTYSNYLSQAGGYGDRAKKSRVYVTYANGYTERSRKFLFFNVRPRIQPGSIITVPYKPKDERRSDLTGPVILSFTGTLILAAVTLISRL
ncbi:SLBB domain-containing protein [Runella slithyformis]|uniref:Soluble ligand binding domain protein n=1 Tax=Runella slithyformis (strain ATCC 29530 / DSM 19594 / LMG 11500 / NCIMB 11436 / LSU 4) TaxID=761193 RepID=A0A7U3ZNB0_RUNSL|nr:SLBB domain-containing protein [Runella slithyformis]AEI50312.1 Soluble ligand binding domain protein [Runella slithyformis DSM 19594]